MSALERRRVIDPEMLADRVLGTLTALEMSREDIVWAIQKGAAKPNDKRSKALIAASNYGGSRIKPYDGWWYASGNEAVVDALDILESRLTNTSALP